MPLANSRTEADAMARISLQDDMKGEVRMPNGGSFHIVVERATRGSTSLSLRRHDGQIFSDPTEAAQICQELWDTLGSAAEPGQSGRQAERA